MSKEKKPILNELFESRNKYKELAEDIDKERNLSKLLRVEEVLRVYNEEPVKEQDMRACLELALLAPNSSNLQQWEFYWVRNREKKNKLIDYCLGQPAAKTAQELVVAVARQNFWKVNQKRMLEKIDAMGDKAPKSARKYYSKIVPLAYRQGFSIRGYLKKLAIEIRELKESLHQREPYNKKRNVCMGPQIDSSSL